MARYDNVPADVQRAMQKVYAWFEVQMYINHTDWNNGDEHAHMRDAADFLNQFLLADV